MYQFFKFFLLFFIQYHPFHFLLDLFKNALAFFLQSFCSLAQLIDMMRYLHLLFLGWQGQVEVFEVGGGNTLLTGRASEIEHGGVTDALLNS